MTDYFSEPVNPLSVNIEMIERNGVIFLILGKCYGHYSKRTKSQGDYRNETLQKNRFKLETFKKCKPFIIWLLKVKGKSNSRILPMACVNRYPLIIIVVGCYQIKASGQRVTING